MPTKNHTKNTRIGPYIQPVLNQSDDIIWCTKVDSSCSTTIMNVSRLDLQVWHQHSFSIQVRTSKIVDLKRPKLVIFIFQPSKSKQANFIFFPTQKIKKKDKMQNQFQQIISFHSNKALCPSALQFKKKLRQQRIAYAVTSVFFIRGKPYKRQEGFCAKKLRRTRNTENINHYYSLTVVWKVGITQRKLNSCLSDAHYAKTKTKAKKKKEKGSKI